MIGGTGIGGAVIRFLLLLRKPGEQGSNIPRRHIRMHSQHKGLSAHQRKRDEIRNRIMRKIRINRPHYRVIIRADEDCIAIGGQAMKRRGTHGAASARDVFRHHWAAKLGLHGIRQNAPHHIGHATNTHGDDHAKRPRLGEGRGRQAKRSSGKEGTTQHGGNILQFIHTATLACPARSASPDKLVFPSPAFRA